MLFGEYMVSQGFCTAEQVDRAVAMQEAGDKRLIGRILLDMGAVTWEQLDKAIEDLRPKLG